MHTLIEYLKKVKDFRLDQGQRHQLWFILLIVILGLMTGHLGYRALGDFAKYQQRHLTKYFRIRRRKVPSYSTIRRAIIGVNWANLGSSGLAVIRKTNYKSKLIVDLENYQN